MATKTTGVVRKFIDINEDDLEWFERTYPNGSLTWILSMLLHEFRTATEHTPNDYAKIATESLQQHIA